MASTTTADWVIAGGGLAGCVLASRLKEQHPDKSIILLENGPDEHHNPGIQTPLACFGLHGSPLHYNYRTAPQKNLNGRQIYHTGGKVLSGSSAVNYGTWTRGDASDYNEWARLVSDPTWSYESMLPYFRKTESYQTTGPGGLNLTAHGADGPLHIRTSDRAYGLRDPVRHALQQVGMRYVHDANNGYPHGFALLAENWHEGKRQPAGVVYPLTGVDVVTNACAQRVLFDTTGAKPRATGVETTDGRTFTATREVIITCGAFRTAQLLLLSGVGPTPELQRHSIPQLLSLPVGLNLHDHCTTVLQYKLAHPERGHAVGSPAFADPSFHDGLPVNWIVTESVPSSRLKAVLEADGEDPTDHPILRDRAHFEAMYAYAPVTEIGSPLAAQIPVDGSHIALCCLMLLPSSRGTVTLASRSATDDPVIDPNYMDTAADRCIMRESIRRMLSTAETPALSEHLDTQTPPEGMPAISSKSSDEEVDARVRAVANTWWHAAGTASMGKVVDTELRVKGAEGLRVCDASVIPTPIAGNLQACVYALAERGAEITGRVT